MWTVLFCVVLMLHNVWSINTTQLHSGFPSLVWKNMTILHRVLISIQSELLNDLEYQL